MIPRLAALASSAGLVVATAGCAQVFGLDDYAMGGSGGGGTTGSTSEATGSGGSSSTTATTGGNASTSSSSGTGGGLPETCRCIPAIPEGWALVSARQTTMAADPAECAGDRRVTLGEVGAQCACTCTELATECAPTLRCWEQPACAGDAVQDFTPGTNCNAIGQRRSCEVLEGEIAGPSCESNGVLGARTGDAFDLCGATQRDAPSCEETERCAEAPDDVDICIEGAGECPAGWDLVEHEVTAAGEFDCATCACAGRACEGASFRASGNWGAGADVACGLDFGVELGSPGCVDVTNPGSDPAQVARLLDPGAPAGKCSPVEDQVAAAYVPGEPSKLCCLPPP